MSVLLMKQKKALEDKKNKLRDKEKFIKEREKRTSQKQMLEVGRLAAKAKIAKIELDSLFGAFLEIAENLSNAEKLAQWKEKSSIENSKNMSGNRITISFKQTPENSVKEQLKKLNFKWNRFRGEYYGIGDKSALSVILKNTEHKIEVIE